MKKDIGSIVALYPTPDVIVGTVIDGKVNWMNVAHVGIFDIGYIMLSIGKIHYTNIGLRANKTASVNIVTREMLVAADYVGLVSGKNTDKSGVFAYTPGILTDVPMIDISPVSMECMVVDNFESQTHDHFILKVIHTHVDESVLNGEGKIDYDILKPVLYEHITKYYYITGDRVGKCWNIGHQFHPKD